MATFLVNKINEDRSFGEATKMSFILHNLQIIGTEYKEGFLLEMMQTRLPYIVQVCICGRYVTYIEVSKYEDEAVMWFFDLNNDDDAALDAAKKIKERWISRQYSNWFMEEYTKLKRHYQENYAAAELLQSETLGLVAN
jgi:hypothetical protein